MDTPAVRRSLFLKPGVDRKMQLNQEALVKAWSLFKGIVPAVSGISVGAWGVLQSASTSLLTADTSRVLWLVAVVVVTSLTTAVTRLIENWSKTRIAAGDNAIKRLDITESSELKQNTLTLDILDRARAIDQQNLTAQREFFAAQIREMRQHYDDRETLLRQEKHDATKGSGEYMLKYELVKLAIQDVGYLVVDQGGKIQLIKVQT